MKETEKQYLKCPFQLLEDISITFRNISGNSPEAGWFPRQVVPFSTGCGNPRLFLFPGVCPPALSLNPLLWFFLLVVAEVLKLSSFTETSFRRFCSLSSSGELPLRLTALLALWGPAGKVESSWERSSLLLQFILKIIKLPLCIWHGEKTYLYHTWWGVFLDIPKLGHLNGGKALGLILTVTVFFSFYHVISKTFLEHTKAIFTGFKGNFLFDAECDITCSQFPNHN